jgi:hypothetical protein
MLKFMIAFLRFFFPHPLFKVSAQPSFGLDYLQLRRTVPHGGVPASVGVCTNENCHTGSHPIAQFYNVLNLLILSCQSSLAESMMF